MGWPHLGILLEADRNLTSYHSNTPPTDILMHHISAWADLQALGPVCHITAEPCNIIGNTREMEQQVRPQQPLSFGKHDTKWCKKCAELMCVPVVTNTWGAWGYRSYGLPLQISLTPRHNTVEAQILVTTWHLWMAKSPPCETQCLCHDSSQNAYDLTLFLGTKRCPPSPHCVCVMVYVVAYLFIPIMKFK